MNTHAISKMQGIVGIRLLNSVTVMCSCHGNHSISFKLRRFTLHTLTNHNFNDDRELLGTLGKLQVFKVINSVSVCVQPYPLVELWIGLNLIGLDSLFTQGKPLANGYYPSNPGAVSLSMTVSAFVHATHSCMWLG